MHEGGLNVLSVLTSSIVLKDCHLAAFFDERDVAADEALVQLAGAWKGGAGEEGSSRVSAFDNERQQSLDVTTRGTFRNAQMLLQTQIKTTGDQGDDHAWQ